MISHGLVSSALFLIVGALYERNHTKEIDKYGGVASKMPVLASFFMISMLGSIGLPGTSGFISEFLSILGVFKANKIIACIAAFGVVLGAVYMLNLYRKIMLGEITNKTVGSFEDLYLYEIIAIAPLCILIIYLGIFPSTVISLFDLAVSKLIEGYN